MRLFIITVLAVMLITGAQNAAASHAQGAGTAVTPPDYTSPVPEPRGPVSPGKGQKDTKGHHTRDGKGKSSKGGKDNNGAKGKRG